MVIQNNKKLHLKLDFECIILLHAIYSKDWKEHNESSKNQPFNFFIWLFL